MNVANAATLTTAPAEADPLGRDEAAPTAGVTPPSVQATSVAAIHPWGRGLNPVVRAANPLLDMIAPLRRLRAGSDLDALRDKLIYLVQLFESDLRKNEIPVESIAAARYMLCTFLDETIASSEGGGNGAWSVRSLLVTLYNESWGGERFFLILYRLSQNPQANLALLELAYVCLTLGFVGRYQAIEGGHGRLASVRERLKAMIDGQRGSPGRELSPRWRGLTGITTRRRFSWAFFRNTALLAGLILLVLQWLYYAQSQRHASAVVEVLSNVHLTPPPAQEKPAPAPAVKPAHERLFMLLAAEIAAGQVAVKDSGKEETVILRGATFFAPGSAVLNEEVLPVLTRVSEALQALPGNVLVIGHTDNTGAAHTRVQDNLRLSEERARTVADFLQQRDAQKTRYRHEGRGETQPQAVNDSAQNRAANRRVEITLTAPVTP